VKDLIKGVGLLLLCLFESQSAVKRNQMTLFLERAKIIKREVSLNTNVILKLRLEGEAYVKVDTRC
jgi:hypothetical protein